MTPVVEKFAIVGRSFQSDKFQGLQQAAVAARAERRVRRSVRTLRAWRQAQDAIVLPKHLFA